MIAVPAPFVIERHDEQIRLRETLEHHLPRKSDALLLVRGLRRPEHRVA
jgi:hypothetical protein